MSLIEGTPIHRQKGTAMVDAKAEEPKDDPATPFFDARKDDGKFTKAEEPKADEPKVEKPKVEKPESTSGRGVGLHR
jgi:hypothetical protein